MACELSVLLSPAWLPPGQHRPGSALACWRAGAGRGGCGAGSIKTTFSRLGRKRPTLSGLDARPPDAAVPPGPNPDKRGVTVPTGASSHTPRCPGRGGPPRRLPEAWLQDQPRGGGGAQPPSGSGRREGPREEGGLPLECMAQDPYGSPLRGPLGPWTGRRNSRREVREKGSRCALKHKHGVQAGPAREVCIVLGDSLLVFLCHCCFGSV